MAWDYNAPGLQFGTQAPDTTAGINGLTAMGIAGNVFAGSMKGSAMNAAAEAANHKIAMMNAERQAASMQNQEVLNINMQLQEDAAVRDSIDLQAKARDAEGQAAAQAASTGASSAQSTRDIQAQTARAAEDIVRELDIAQQQYAISSKANVPTTIGSIDYNPALNIGLGIASGLTKSLAALTQLTGE